ncbi:diphthamide biosynthesis protein [Gymnopus androsaceus JB14]|uniref:2-(3-amino-3-carboxypropyl)histidine synthase subunit 2 n=1 Tax=Gymnopus androsaceus JB14 TaxID=1447944 RepID=A0A6A4H9K7_9AGAR|nr:diphthamide biosynthesis protein [Gymnopus androsaceus JB14]
MCGIIVLLHTLPLALRCSFRYREEAIHRTLDVQLDQTADNLKLSAEFDAFYEIERIAREIEQGDFKRVALQFPDELLHDSVQIFRRLKRRINSDKELYVLADTSYGSCCVDEVAAQHIDANAVVHYGHACMSQTYRLPDCVTSLLECFSSHSSSESSRRKNIVLRHDVAYTHQAGQIVAQLGEALENLGSQLTYTSIPDKLLPSSSSSEEQSTDPSSSRNTTVEESTIFYIGDESLGLTNLLMTHSSCDVYLYSPTSKASRLESGRTNKVLMRRYATMQKGRDSDVFGILVGTLGVASYLPLIKHIRSLLTASHKKSYTISVGKLNPSKLANFMEIECFVLVACPENSLVDAKDFYRPIITPYELEVALRAEQSWTGRYVLDFEELLAEHANDHGQTDADDDDEHEVRDEDSPVFSLVTGKYRHAKRFGPANGPSTAPSEASASASSSALVQRNQDSAVALLSDSAAGQFLHSRTYQGLDPRLGQDAPGVLEQGRSGIARGYGGGADEGKS